MALKSKSKRFHLSFSVVIRLLIFSLLVYFSIIYLSSGKTNLPTLPTPQLIELLPPSSQNTLNNFSSTPQAKFINEKIAVLQQATIGFPEKQIKEIQKLVVNRLYSSILKSIDSP